MCPSHPHPRPRRPHPTPMIEPRPFPAQNTRTPQWITCVLHWVSPVAPPLITCPVLQNLINFPYSLPFFLPRIIPSSRTYYPRHNVLRCTVQIASGFGFDVCYFVYWTYGMFAPVVGLTRRLWGRGATCAYTFGVNRISGEWTWCIVIRLRIAFANVLFRL